MSAEVRPTALDIAPAAVADLVGEMDLPCEAPQHGRYGAGVVTHLLRPRVHEDCSWEFFTACEGCVARIREAVAILRSRCFPVRCASCDVASCTHHAALDSHPIRCAP